MEDLKQKKEIKIYISFKCLKEIKIYVIYLYLLCYTENNKTRTFWAWKTSKNKNTESRQIITVSYKKVCNYY